MGSLVIVESPAKAKTVEKYLGSDYKVKASVGHIRDLPKKKKGAIDIEGGFIPRYEVVEKKKKTIQELRRAAQKADEVILATDPDREGEAIAWHVSEVLDLDTPKRIVFHEITKDAVREALSHPRGIDSQLVSAQEARRVLDRLVGYDLSGLIWKKVRYGLSAGRVQSPALRIIMERERQIRAFEPEDYWVITARVHPVGKKEDTLTVTCTEEPRDEKEVERIVTESKNGSWSVTDIKEQKRSRRARAPFTTSTMQQTASSRLSFTPSRTMRAAQKLYEKGLITYMRTDSTLLAASAQSQILALVAKEYGTEYVEQHIYKSKSKNVQEAHEAVRPTDVTKKTASGSQDEKKLYDLIWRRAVASQMASAQLMQTTIITSPTDAVPDFKTTGSRVLFAGWLKVDSAARGEDVDLPKVQQGDDLTLLEVASEAKQTQPPPRYTDAGLIKELEKRGIGRPSTYASIIKTLENRHYVEKEGRTLVPTDTGDVVSSFLEENFTEYISDDFTSEMEDELDEIARGEREYEKTLREFYEPFRKEVDTRAKTAKKITTLGDAPEEFLCPKCDKKMVIKLGKSGKFMSCSTFPDCDGARTIDGEAMKEPKGTGRTCPKCEKGELIERHGRYGKFIGCNRYPKCKYIEEDEEEAKKRDTGVACPECVAAGRQGTMTEKRGRYGVFYACSNYPDCKYTIKAKPTGETCDLCGSLYMEGTKTIPNRCSNKKCPNHRPDKLEKK